MTDYRTVIVKIAERCNLACPYCYMYSGPDQSWRKRPRKLSPENAALLVDRAAELLEGDPAIHLSLEFHGGEPLLYGHARFAKLLAHLRSRLPAGRVSYCLQTNGTLLDAEWCALFADYGLRWGISCDGPAQVHDRFRFGHNGKGSHTRVEAAIRLSMSQPAWHRYFGGVLAVIDTTTDSAEIVRYFHALGVEHLDLLLPDSTHAAPPAHLPGFTQEALRRYLHDAFAEWVAIDDAHFHIRTFETFAKGFFGIESNLDAFGAGLDWLTVVESDGTYQLLDVLHTCGEEFTSIGGDLSSRSLTEQYARQAAASLPPCQTCLACPVFDLCGGGYLPHRFDGKGFDNPSVHCEALMGTIREVGDYLRAQLPPGVWTDRLAVHALAT